MGQLFGKLSLSGTRCDLIFVPKKIFDTIFYYKYKKAFSVFKKWGLHFYCTLFADMIIHTLLKKYFFSQAPIFCNKVRPIFGPIIQLLVKEKSNCKKSHRLICYDNRSSKWPFRQFSVEFFWQLNIFFWHFYCLIWKMITFGCY